MQSMLNYSSALVDQKVDVFLRKTTQKKFCRNCNLTIYFTKYDMLCQCKLMTMFIYRLNSITDVYMFLPELTIKYLL